MTAILFRSDATFLHSRTKCTTTSVQWFMAKLKAEIRATSLFLSYFEGYHRTASGQSVAVCCCGLHVLHIVTGAASGLLSLHQVWNQTSPGHKSTDAERHTAETSKQQTNNSRNQPPTPLGQSDIGERSIRRGGGHVRSVVVDKCQTLTYT